MSTKGRACYGCRTSRSSTTTSCSFCVGSAWPYHRRRSWRSSAPTARARPPSCEPSPACSTCTTALSIGEHGYVLETGKVVLDKPARDLLGDEDVREFYLGLHPEGTVKSFRDVKHYKRRKRWLS